MNYVYDIYLNFNDIAYDFFEWDKNDKITHIKKIPIYKVSTDNFKLILNNKVKFNNLFVKKIYNKTDLFKKEKIEYSVLICNNDNIIAVLLNKEGVCIKKSFLFIDEELEVLDEVKDIEKEDINIEVISKLKIILKTRNDIKIDNFINKEINNIDINKLKYIYYELFNKKDNFDYDIKKKLYLIKKDKIKYKKLYDILKLTSTSNN